jgi:hypothetical protein
MSLEEMLARSDQIHHRPLPRNADTADYDRHVEVFHPEANMIIQGAPILEGRAAIIDAVKQGVIKRRAFGAKRSRITFYLRKCATHSRCPHDFKEMQTRAALRMARKTL